VKAKQLDGGARRRLRTDRDRRLLAQLNRNTDGPARGKTATQLLKNEVRGRRRRESFRDEHSTRRHTCGRNRDRLIPNAAETRIRRFGRQRSQELARRPQQPWEIHGRETPGGGSCGESPEHAPAAARFRRKTQDEADGGGAEERSANPSAAVKTENRWPCQP
jgi:hypothetical protein